MVFFTGDLVFTVLIKWKEEHGEKGDKDNLEILRVVLLDGLFLVMGITLGICIIVVGAHLYARMRAHTHTHLDDIAGYLYHRGIGACLYARTHTRPHACAHTHAHTHTHTLG